MRVLTTASIPSFVSPPTLPNVGVSFRFFFFNHHIAVLPAAELAARFQIYSEALNRQRTSLPPWLDRWGVHPAETVSQLSPVVISRHMNHHGCVMLLYSLKAKNDMKAREKLVESARALAELGRIVRGKRGLKRMHASLLLMVSHLYHDNLLCVTEPMPVLMIHQLNMANATRVLALYVSTPEVKASTELFATCSESLGMLIDILDDASVIFPTWGKSPYSSL